MGSCSSDFSRIQFRKDSSEISFGYSQRNKNIERENRVKFKKKF
ncbi:hypothetical protein LEP1GSC074_3430 [Leptospira noguchii str. Hook]|uniref:Uncharacterized protein n=1 Tax=Leptospira noguchii serovar Autumnalis str. ZUN142 TaxID=1085540 RepID=M6UV18_9LEPT|nr:hypothetical protein LEP1GSC041_3401 [Leptospira noguchii str. 2006001870]EMO41123.1 hypothetical protein LEP1GSC186_4707 [Leptospira noguchii serovar Autumnalis str. ZUN142]EMS82841.1 hypothetical protein LEP1GSC074_3430 [Leptospira noguchii str. Hook]